MRELVILLVTVCLFPSFAQTPSRADIDAGYDAIVKQKLSPEKNGASVLIAHHDQIVYQNSFGMADLESNKPVTTETIFRIGSMTKQFTATAILRLVELGKIDLHGEITDYLPDYPARGKNITIENLLQHTSGIKEYTIIPQLMSPENKASRKTVDEMMKMISSSELNFTPGEKHEYSNTNYFLLGAIIEKVSGLSYDDYLRKTFFKRLGMKSTAADEGRLDIKKIATGYKPGKNGPVKADYVHSSSAFAAGSLYSTAMDQWKWNKALLNHNVLSKVLNDKAWQPLKLKDGTEVDYGYGWSFSRIDQFKVIDHGGSIDGFMGYSLLVPEQELYVCVLTNSIAGNPRTIAFALARKAMGQPRVSNEAIALTEDQLEKYTGFYQTRSGESRTIKRNGSHLFSQRNNGKPEEIFPYTTNSFFYHDSDTRLVFDTDSKGFVNTVTVMGSTWTPEVAVRTVPPLASAEKIAIDLDPVKFDLLTGEYELAPNYIVKVWREENVFMAQSTGQRAFQIHPETESKFFVKEIPAQLEFLSDAQSKVTGLILTFGGRATQGRKIK